MPALFLEENLCLVVADFGILLLTNEGKQEGLII